ncbi:MAG: IS1634 family transposase, partial [Actinobacteria bacterium]|nr:IS1634 family transposase [Actinomycetota bacterium]
MYIKRHSVRRGKRRYVYLRLVESYRDERGKVRHRVLRTLGREDELKASGQLNQLAASFARLDPPLAGIRRDVGPLLLVSQLARELAIGAAIDRVLACPRRSELSAGELVIALVANRLCAPAPLYDIAGWASGTAIQELFGTPAALLDDDRLGRGLEAFAPHAEAVRGALAARAIERFGIDAGRLHVDLTAVRFTGAYEDSALVAKGWGQGQGVGRQLRALQASSADGVSLYLRPEAGNAAELTLIGAALERLRSLAGDRPALLVCDSAVGQPKTLCQIQRAGLSFIAPLKANVGGWRERYLEQVGAQALAPLGYVSERERELPPKLRTRYRGAIRDWQPCDPESGEQYRFRIAYIHSSEEQREVKAARERALGRAEEQLARITNGLGGRHYKTKRQVDRRVGQILTGQVKDLIEVKTATRKRRPTISWKRDEQAIANAARADGVYALATNLADRRLGARAILDRYKGQQIVERRNRDLKQTLRVRPIFLHKDERIHALVSIIGIALLIFGLIESELRKRLAEHEQQLMPGLATRGSGGQADRAQRARRVPGAGAHLHARGHRSRSAHPHPATDPRSARGRDPVARAGEIAVMN